LNSPGPGTENSLTARPGQQIPYEHFLDCVHCGLCTAACPTYAETGNENDGPRGRIYLMRAIVDGRLELTESARKHLDLCLDCRSCETACPSGVQYGRILEPFRVDMQNIPAAANASDSGPPAWFRKFILYGLFPYRKRLAITLMPARLMQRLGLDRLARSLGLTRLLPVHLQRMHDQLPVLQPAGPPLPNFLPAVGTRRATVALFLGCVADAMFRHVHWATARVLQQNGCDVLIPSNQSCCGAIHYHSGGSGPLLNLMLQNCESFADERIDAVIVNVAGCGSMLKDYSHIIDELHGSTESQNQQIRNLCSRIRDVHEFLADLGPVQPSGTLNLKVAYQDACHLQHAQRIRQQPRDLLNLIPGLKLTRVDEPELCCGAAGTYNLTQPEMADRLGKRKTDHLLAESPDLIASANAGCSLQLQAQLRRAGKNIPVLHPVEILDLSYRNIQPRES
jgi:glycolate oxidase iron-sulfur subunit